MLQDAEQLRLGAADAAGDGAALGRRRVDRVWDAARGASLQFGRSRRVLCSESVGLTKSYDAR